MNVIENKVKVDVQHESPADEHRLRSERIAAQGVHLGKAKGKYLIPLVGLAVLASMAFAQA
ncbi:MAG TPA: hypothetical protein VF670_09365 [Duganella sp.]|jgi:hypothetical protein